MSDQLKRKQQQITDLERDYLGARRCAHDYRRKWTHADQTIKKIRFAFATENNLNDLLEGVQKICDEYQAKSMM